MDQEQNEKRLWTRSVRLDSRIVIALSLVLAVSAVAFFQLTSSQPSLVKTPELTPQRFVDLSRTDEIPSDRQPIEALGKAALRVAVAPVLSPEHSIQVYGDLVEFLAVELGREPLLLQRESYAETNDLVRYGLCDLALVCTYSFVRGEQEFGMEVLVVPVIDGVTDYYSLIIVAEGNQANSLSDLKDQRFASADIISTSGWLYPAMWLKEHGIDADEFFSEHLTVGSHDRSIRAVISGYADAAAVHSLVYEQLARENPEISRKTRIIQKSPPYGMPPLVVSPAIDPALRENLRSILLAMHQSEIGRGVLKQLNIEKFIEPEDGLYDDVRTAVRTWEARW